MSKFILSARSLDRLQGVHPDLVSVVKLAIKLTVVDFTILEGLRTLQRQKELLAQHKTNTLNSRHLYGFAVDVGAYVDGHLLWTPKELYMKIADAMKRAAKELNIPIVWGGDWTGKAAKLGDIGHFELSKVKYPDSLQIEPLAA